MPSAPRVSAVREFSSDRKSTRLNSSHLVISYAVFCLKKKILIDTRVVMDPSDVHALGVTTERRRFFADAIERRAPGRQEEDREQESDEHVGYQTVMLY